MPNSASVSAFTPDIQPGWTNQHEITRSSLLAAAGAGPGVTVKSGMPGWRGLWTGHGERSLWALNTDSEPRTSSRAAWLSTLTLYACEWTLAQLMCNYAQALVTCYSAYLILCCFISFYFPCPRLPTLKTHIQWHYLVPLWRRTSVPARPTCSLSPLQWCFRHLQFCAASTDDIGLPRCLWGLSPTSIKSNYSPASPTLCPVSAARPFDRCVIGTVQGCNKTHMANVHAHCAPLTA